MEPWTPEEEAAGEIVARDVRRRRLRAACLVQLFFGLLFVGVGVVGTLGVPFVGILLFAVGGTLAVVGGVGYAQN